MKQPLLLCMLLLAAADGARAGESAFSADSAMVHLRVIAGDIGRRPMGSDAGNAEAYDAGVAADQKLFFQHSASWIPPGYPGEGHILVFNNGNNRPSGQYSSVDEFAPPVDSNREYYLEPGSAYGPEEYTWSYTATPPLSFYSPVFGGALRLKDGNTLICGGTSGKFFEVTPDETQVWEYTNPYPSPSQNDVFKIDFILPQEPPQPPQNNTSDLECMGNLSWTNIEPGATVVGSFQLHNGGDAGSLLNWTVNASTKIR